MNQTKKFKKKIHSAEAYNNPCVVLNGQVIAMQQNTEMTKEHGVDEV